MIFEPLVLNLSFVSWHLNGGTSRLHKPTRLIVIWALMVDADWSEHDVVILKRVLWLGSHRSTHSI